MKATCFGAVVLFLATGIARSSPVAFSISIAAVDAQIKSGSEARVEVTLTNNSNRVATLEFSSPLCDYVVEVRDHTGRLAPDTEIKAAGDCANRATGAHGFSQLKPNESITNSIPINIFSNLSLPGQYSVQIQWKAPKEFGEVVVKSNTIRITVTP